MSVRLIILPFILLLLCSSALGSESQEGSINQQVVGCENYLGSGDYERSFTFSNEGPLTLKAEQNSIEFLRPGVIAKLIQLRVKLIFMRRFQEARPYGPSDFEELLTLIQKDLLKVGQFSNDLRMKELVQSFILDAQGKTEGMIRSGSANGGNFSRFINQLTASLWELVVACLFDGEKIFLNKTTKQIYSQDFSSIKERVSMNDLSSLEKNQLDREIDVAIQSSSGTWRWIEVKDWGVKSALDKKTQEKLFRQSQGQNFVRQALGLDIQMFLVLKYGLSRAEFLHYQSMTHFDEIKFIFPRNP
ncbi:hypothetical protein GW916_00755 [bacterium]|nr:hypothetical protein [bacterium]